MTSRETIGESLTITELASTKAKSFYESGEGEGEVMLRVFVKAGGCSGYSYGMAFDASVVEGDRIFTDRGVKIKVDPRSFELLAGSEIDYIDNLMGGGFSLNNPNATSACGCGSSFRVDGKAAPKMGSGENCH